MQANSIKETWTKYLENKLKGKNLFISPRISKKDRKMKQMFFEAVRDKNLKEVNPEIDFGIVCDYLLDVLNLQKNFDL
jgi:hypothetical protein